MTIQMSVLRRECRSHSPRSQAIESGEIASDGGGSDSEAECWSHQTIGKALSMVLHACVADRRRLNEVHNLAGCCRQPDPQGTHRDLAVSNDSGGKYGFALTLDDR